MGSEYAAGPAGKVCGRIVPGAVRLRSGDADGSEGREPESGGRYDPRHEGHGKGHAGRCFVCCEGTDPQQRQGAAGGTAAGDGKIANGPGHNGYFYIPEEDLYLIVYHRHQPDIKPGNARFLCIDIMKFDEDGKIMPIVMTNDWEYPEKKMIL